MEWESQGYEENSGRMRWIIDKGLALGKKMLITGFVISSAPVVLPPLMFISAVGVACSVPYGLFLASYACTEKIMSKLLPIPKTPLFVEDSLTKYEVDSGFRGKVEMKNEDEVNALKGGLYAQKEFEVVEKNGYEEDVNEDVEREKESSKDIDIQIEGTLEKEKEEPLMEKNKDAAEEICGVMIVIEGMEKNVSNTGVEEVPFEVTNVAVELCQGGDNKDNEELVRETRGLIERIRDEGETDTNVKGTVTQLGEGNAYGQKVEENGDKLILLENVEVKAQLQPSSIGSGTSEGKVLESILIKFSQFSSWSLD